jgi:hypothetical protein
VVSRAGGAVLTFADSALTDVCFSSTTAFLGSSFLKLVKKEFFDFAVEVF